MSRKIFLSVSLLIFGSFSVFAQTFHGSGSRDLYPNGVEGGRAKLRASTLVSAEAVPFPTLGEHYVYAEEGEQIAVAFSAQGMQSGSGTNRGRIRITTPTGSIVYSSATNGSTVGRIAGGLVSGVTTNRQAELLGPRLPGVGSGGGYIPFVHVAGDTGVYKVEFISGLGQETTEEGSSTADPGRANVAADSNWTQANNTIYISAWDISVSNAAGTEWISGRTWANVLNMDIFSITQSGSDWVFSNVGGFYGKAFVLTKDGYVYRVNNNGNNGITFTFFSNNNGFIDSNNEPTYLSNPLATAADFTHDPRSADANGNITNKIFYSAPNLNLPATATGSGLPGGSTWLRVERIAPEVYEVNIIGYDGTVGQVSNKGGHFYFETDNLASRYTIKILPPVSQPTLFAERTLTGPAQEGENWVPWDGKDGNGVDLPPGIYEPQVAVSLQTAEVHFPYIDMELNPNGIIIELLALDYNSVEQNNVYWNDTGLSTSGISGSLSSPINASHTVNAAGENSATNGHNWGAGTTATSGSFGDLRSMDTWTFVEGAAQTFSPEIFVAQSDVETISITSDHTGVVSQGDSWNYTVEVRNNGSMDIKTNTDPLQGLLTGPASFMLYVPPGITLDPSQVTFLSNTCLDEDDNSASIQIMGTPTFTDGVYIAHLDMPVGCIATFTIPVTATGAVLTGDGNVNTWATMLRPDDFTDIDATNPFPSQKPEDPFFEADGIGIPIHDILDDDDNVLHAGMGNAIFTNTVDILGQNESNNIKLNSQPFMVADVQITKTGTRTADSGGTATFILTVKNNGPSVAHNVTVEDELTSRYTFNGTNYSASQGSVSGTSTVIWSAGTLAVNATATLTFTVTNGGSGDRTNTATVEADEFDPDLNNNSSTISEPPNTGPGVDLGITKTVDKPTPNVGEEVTFTITLNRVSGTDAVDNIEVTDVLPQGYTYNGHTASQGVYDPTTGIWYVGTINSGTNRTLTLKAYVNPLAGDSGAYLNTASITAASRADSNLTNNTASATVVPQVVDLEITKTVDDETPVAGEEVTFTVTVTNNGPADATGVTVYDLLPDGYAFEDKDSDAGSYDEGDGIWTIGTLSNGTTVTLEITAIVKEAGQYVNSAVVSGTVNETDYTNNTAQATVTPDCTIRNISPKVNE